MWFALICTDDEELAFGMRCVSAVVKAHADHCRLIFLETGGKSYTEAVLGELSKLVASYDVIGISCLANGANKAKQVLNYLKPLGKVTIWGGVHASLNPEDCAEYADFVCIGEGEGAIIDMIERVGDRQACKDIQNLAYKEGSIFVSNDLRPLIGNLDDLPFPDFSFDDEYHLTREGLKKVASLYNVERNGQIAVNGSRGCAFRCTYCCNVNLKNLYSGQGQYIRRMSVDRLIELSKYLISVFPKGKYFYFIDEDFSAKPLMELVELSERFPREIGLPFECLAHPARMNEQKVDLLVKAGMFRVRIGIETGSERTKKEIYNRHVSNENVVSATRVLSQYPQVAPVYFFIYANPYENRDDLLATLNLIKELPGGSNIQAFELIFFPGSLLYDRAIADGLITGYSDSSSEVNYYGGFHHGQYPWKKKNLYLNGLLFLSGGKTSRFKVGSLPRFVFNFAIQPSVVDVFERHTQVIKIMIAMQGTFFQLRSKLVQALKLFIKDPFAIYNFPYYIKSKLPRRINMPGVVD